VDGCWNRAETSSWMLAPYGDRWLPVVADRDQWMYVGTEQRPVGGCWHRMGTGHWLLLTNTDE
jgi:hypothetical protein